MKYQFKEQGDVVFEINSDGKYFYVILDGAVSVYISTKENITSE